LFRVKNKKEIQIMNTLSRAVTAQFFPDSKTYQTIKQHWRLLMNSERRHELTASHHLLYLALMGKDWRRGFTPVTNPRKLVNGAHYGWALFRALALLHSSFHNDLLLAPFDGLITGETLTRIRQLVPKITPYTHAPEAYASEYPFAAYQDQASD
jgi:hypothetical protein